MREIRKVSMGKRCREDKTGFKSMFAELGRIPMRKNISVNGQGTENL